MEFKPIPSKWRHIQAAWVAISYRLACGLLRLMALFFWPRRRPQHVERMAVFRIGHIGDITCALPAMRALRRVYPTAHLTLITSTGRINSPGAKELLGGADWIDEIHTYSFSDISSMKGQWRFAMYLRQRNFDLWFNLSPDLTNLWRELRDICFVRLVGPRWARGWSIGTLSFAAQSQSEYLAFTNDVDRNLSILSAVGISTGCVDFGLPQSLQAKAFAEGLLPHMDTRFWIAIAPGAKRSTNRWVGERFVEVGKYLTALGVGVVLVGGQDDAKECEQMASDIGVNAVSLAGRLTLPQSCELLRKCRFVICVDSGVQHLASAVNTPCISLFSFWQLRGKWWPHGEKNVVIQKWVPCHSCFIEECPNDNLCMKRIEVVDVISSVNKMLIS